MVGWSEVATALYRVSVGQHDVATGVPLAEAPIGPGARGADLAADRTERELMERSQLAALFHPWPAGKRGGSDPDRCPECGQVSYRRVLRWDESSWRRSEPATLICSSCGLTWVPAPIAEDPSESIHAGAQPAGAGRPPQRRNPQ